MADLQEPNPFELACWAARECAREVDTLRKVWRSTVIDAPEGYLDSRIEGKFMGIVGTVSRLTFYRKRSLDVFPPVKDWVRAVRPEAPVTLPGTPKAASYHDTAFEMADATLWRFDTSLNWGARLLELINGPSISAAELKRILNTDAPGSLRAQLAERLQSIHGERFLWGELCRAMESIEAFDANDLMARIEHEAGRAISTGTNKVPLVKNPGQGKHPWGDDDPDTPCTLDKLAVFLGIPENDKIGRERLRGRLRTWQKNHPRDVVEVENRKPRQAGYLYPIGEVWPSVSDLKSSG